MKLPNRCQIVSAKLKDGLELGGPVVDGEDLVAEEGAIFVGQGKVEGGLAPVGKPLVGKACKHISLVG